MISSKYKLIGQGKQANVYTDHTYAYKVFNEGYPLDWIQYEFDVQKEINTTHLPCIRYYSILDSNCIKMDYIKQNTLGYYLKSKQVKNGAEILISLLKDIHTYTDLKIPSFVQSASQVIDSIDLTEDKKDLCFDLINTIEDKQSLLHLDFHFLNIMGDGPFIIIDWVNAKLGNPIYDYAQTFVILNEYAYRIGLKFRSLILKDKTIDTTYLDESIYIMAVLRLREERSMRTLSLMNDLYIKLNEKRINLED